MEDNMILRQIGQMVIFGIIRSGPSKTPRTICAVSLCVSAFVYVALSERVYATEYSGDFELLRQVSFAYQKNLSSISTWQANGERMYEAWNTDQVQPENQPNKRVTHGFSFAADRVNRNSRVDMDLDEIPLMLRNPKHLEAPPVSTTVRPFTRSIQTGDGEVYRYFGNLSDDEGGKRGEEKDGQLVRERAENADLGRRPEWIEPTRCFTPDSDQDVGDMSKFLLSVAESSKSIGGDANETVTVKRDGSRVTLTIDNTAGKNVLNSYTYDLSKGGCLVKYGSDTRNRGILNDTAISYEEHGGVWVPVEHKSTTVHTASKDRAAKTMVWRVALRKQVVNEPIAASVFSPDSLGIKLDELIVDRTYPNAPIVTNYSGHSLVSGSDVDEITAFMIGHAKTQPSPTSKPSTANNKASVAHETPSTSEPPRSGSGSTITYILLGILVCVGAYAWISHRKSE